jgi:hypothetical protein
MCEKGVKHVSAGSRASLARDLIEMQKIRKLFCEEESTLCDALLYTDQMLTCVTQIGLCRRSQQRGAMAYAGEHEIELNSFAPSR